MLLCVTCHYFEVYIYVCKYYILADEVVSESIYVDNMYIYIYAYITAQRADALQ
jgi:hypothetical protein